MRLSKYAEKMGVTYRTAWKWFKNGMIQGAYQLPSGTIIVPEERNLKPECVVIYARVSSSENKNNLDSQAQGLREYAMAKGYQIHHIIKEIGSGVNDKRKQLKKILTDGVATRIIVEHRDRLTRFGFHYLETLLKHIGCQIEVVDETKEDKQELMEDLIAIITSFCARYYGLRRSKRKTQKIIGALKNEAVT